MTITRILGYKASILVTCRKDEFLRLRSDRLNVTDTWEVKGFIKKDISKKKKEIVSKYGLCDDIVEDIITVPYFWVITHLGMKHNDYEHIFSNNYKFIEFLYSALEKREQKYGHTDKFMEQYRELFGAIALELFMGNTVSKDWIIKKFELSEQYAEEVLNNSFFGDLLEFGVIYKKNITQFENSSLSFFFMIKEYCKRLIDAASQSKEGQAIDLDFLLDIIFDESTEKLRQDALKTLTKEEKNIIKEMLEGMADTSEKLEIVIKDLLQSLQ